MDDDINRTSHSSPRDYGMTLPVLSDAVLIEEAQENRWLARTLQMTDCDYQARFHECERELHKRNLTLDK